MASKFGRWFAAVVAVGATLPSFGAHATASSRWLTSWAPSDVAEAPGDPYLAAAFPAGHPSAQTVRMIVRTTAPGDRLRLRLSNRFGNRPVELGPVRVALRDTGPALVSGSNRLVLFGGHHDALLAPGTDIVSDPVPFSLTAGQELAVSLHVRQLDAPVTWHKVGNWVTYVSSPHAGDTTADESGTAFSGTSVSTFWLDGVEEESTYPGTVVAFGDSITDGTYVAPDAHQTWPDVLSDRFGTAPPRLRHAVVNAGITGNQIQGGNWSSVDGAPGIVRLHHDVLDLSGVTHIIVLEGTNDLAHGASTRDVISAFSWLVSVAHHHGIRVMGATITPRSDVGWNSAREIEREQVNRWIRESHTFDGVADFDRVIRDPNNPHRMAPQYDGGDSLHPNAIGLAALAKSIELSFFD